VFRKHGNAKGKEKLPRNLETRQEKLGRESTIRLVTNPKYCDIFPCFPSPVGSQEPLPRTFADRAMGPETGKVREEALSGHISFVIIAEALKSRDRDASGRSGRISISRTPCVCPGRRCRRRFDTEKSWLAIVARPRLRVLRVLSRCRRVSYGRCPFDSARILPPPPSPCRACEPRARKGGFSLNACQEQKTSFVAG